MFRKKIGPLKFWGLKKFQHPETKIGGDMRGQKIPHRIMWGYRSASDAEEFCGATDQSYT